MATQFYKIVRHAPRRWSIDRYNGGRFLHQVAFWFKARAEAERRMESIKTEDSGKVDWQPA